MNHKINKLEAVHSFTVMPMDANFNTNTVTDKWDILFGGNMMYHIDYAGAKVVRRATYGVDMDMFVTASIDKIDFKKPTFVGDIVTMVSSIKALGRSSIQVRVKVRREDMSGKIEDVCSANMVFVTVKDNKSVPHGLTFKKLEDESN